MTRFAVPDLMARIAIWLGWLGAVIFAGSGMGGRGSDYGKMAMFVLVTATVGSAQHVLMSGLRALFSIAEDTRTIAIESRATRELLAKRAKPAGA